MSLQIRIQDGTLSKTAHLKDCVDKTKAGTFITTMNNYIGGEIAKASVTTAPETVTVPVNVAVDGATVLERVVLYYDYLKAADGEIFHGQYTLFTPDSTDLEVDPVLGQKLNATAITAIMAAIKAACDYSDIFFTSQRYLKKSGHMG